MLPWIVGSETFAGYTRVRHRMEHKPRVRFGIHIQMELGLAFPCGNLSPRRLTRYGKRWG